MLSLMALLPSVIKETKDRTLEESGTVFDSDITIENLVVETQSSTHSTEDEKPSQTFYEEIIG